MPFLSEPVPQRGIAHPVAERVRRIVAGNPGPMTYHGTNTYLFDAPEGVTVIDPGPDDAAHVAAILAAAEAPIRRILVSHWHPDHLGAAAALQAATSAPVAAFARSAKADFIPDMALVDGETIGEITVLHTPGHAADHLCFALPGGTLFSADHVMSWSTSIVSPPDGDMGDYIASLRRLLGRGDRLYLPGHGPPLPAPETLVRAMLSHRIAREQAVLGALSDDGASSAAVVAQLYGGIAPELHAAAERTVLAHLLKLQAEGRADLRNGTWHAIGD